MLTCHVNLSLLCVCVAQYDDFEDSEGVTSAGEGLHTLNEHHLQVYTCLACAHWFSLNKNAPPVRAATDSGRSSIIFIVTSLNT